MTVGLLLPAGMRLDWSGGVREVGVVGGPPCGWWSFAQALREPRGPASRSPFCATGAP
jgi:hypothetical protein